MDEEKKTLGRAKIYTGEPEEQIKNRPQTGTEQASPGDRRSRRAEPIGTRPKEHLAAEPGRRRKDIETDAKMRRLWLIFGILVVILVIAIIYEIVLGHAAVETGSQRMNQAAQETEQLKETEQVRETEQTGETESEQDTDADAAGEDGSTADTDASGTDENSAGTGTADGTTLAGLDD